MSGIMNGTKKTGVHEHHANKLMENPHVPQEAKDIWHSHLGLVESAKKLAPGIVESLQPAILEKCLRDVVEKQGVKAPIELQRAILRIKLKHLCNNTSTLENIKPLLDCLRPWLRTGEPAKEFDVFGPTVVDIDMDAKEKIQMFTSRLTSSWVVTLVRKGETGRKALTQACGLILEDLEEASNIESLDDDLLSGVIEFAGIIRPLHVLLEEGRLEYLVEELDGLKKLQQCMGEVGMTLSCVIGNAMKREEWFEHRINTLVKNEFSLAAAATSIAEDNEKLEAMGRQDLFRNVVIIGEACKNLTKCQMSLDAEFLEHFHAQLHKVVLEYIADLLGAVEKKALQNQDMVQISYALREFSFAFPDEAQIDAASSVLAALSSRNQKDFVKNLLLERCADLRDVLMQEGAEADKAIEINHALKVVKDSMGTIIDEAASAATLMSVCNGCLARALETSSELEGNTIIDIVETLIAPCCRSSMLTSPSATRPRPSVWRTRTSWTWLGRTSSHTNNLDDCARRSRLRPTFAPRGRPRCRRWSWTS